MQWLGVRKCVTVLVFAHYQSIISQCLQQFWIFCSFLRRDCQLFHFYLSFSKWNRECLFVNLFIFLDLRIILIDGLPVLQYLLLSTEHTVVQLNCVLRFVDREFPDEEDLRSIIQMTCQILVPSTFATYDLTCWPTSRLS